MVSCPGPADAITRGELDSNVDLVLNNLPSLRSVFGGTGENHRVPTLKMVGLFKAAKAICMILRSIFSVEIWQVSEALLR